LGPRRDTHRAWLEVFRSMLQWGRGLGTAERGAL